MFPVINLKEIGINLRRIMDKRGITAKHVGSALMNRCVEETQKCGMNAIRLEVLNTNTKAIDFYHHSGLEFEKRCSDDSNHLIKRFQ